MPDLNQKIAFLNQYVTFRRDYEELEFHIQFINGESFPPGPSEWDIRLIAKVPTSQIEAWIPPGVTSVATIDSQWLDSIPTLSTEVEFGEWYVESHRVIGVDRKQSCVAYHLWAR
jgi:hypothetical protein